MISEKQLKALSELLINLKYINNV